MNLAAHKNGQDVQALAPINVLVLDDDAFDRKRMRRWVERAKGNSVQLTEAVCLHSFADQLDNGRYDLVLMDFGLADGTGLDALKLLRANKDNASSFVVMISGREDDGLKDMCLLQGCDAFLTKSDLGLATVRTVLNVVDHINVEPDLPRRGGEQTALSFWKDRAQRRKMRDDEQGRIGNLTVLKQILGEKLAATPIAESDAETSKLKTHMSSALRLFIEEFLADEDFVFEELQFRVGAKKSDPETKH
ncbi:MAG: response regulator [Aliishimia sp.]